jgi:hypothetical protein
MIVPSSLHHTSHAAEHFRRVPQVGEGVARTGRRYLVTRFEILV